MEPQTCKWCGAELAKGTVDFCTEKCRFEFITQQLHNENLELTEKLRLLNCARTAITPDTGMTVDANVQAARFNCRAWINEMDNDTLFIYHKMVLAIAEESYLVITKKRIKNETDGKVKKQLAEAMEKREETTLPVNKQASAREQFIRKQLKEGFSQKEAETLWARESKQEKAIDGMMKALGCTREAAMNMLKLVPDGVKK